MPLEADELRLDSLDTSLEMFVRRRLEGRIFSPYDMPRMLRGKVQSDYQSAELTVMLL